jgi:hypothetical protein
MYRLFALRQLHASFAGLALLASAPACAGVEDPELDSTASAAPEVGAQRAALVSDGTCSTDMWDAIVRANQGADWLLNNALENFNTEENGNLRATWFGSGMDAPDAARDILFRIVDIRLYTNGSKEVSIHCEPPSDPNCFPGAYAYHLPDEEVIHLCPDYFTYDHNQGDYDHNGVSQVGGLLHELSHLDGTSDTYGAYGYDACRSLANASTASAINNADTWRYYLMQVQ